METPKIVSLDDGQQGQEDTKMKTSTTLMVAIWVFAALAGCGGSAEPAAPQPPPQIFIVTHKDLDGTVTTDRALKYYWAGGGCVHYLNPEDKASGILNFRLVCGGTTRVRPEGR